MTKYDVNNIAVSSLLASIKSGEIAIPEIQRPFVWDSTKVRDLIDSLYQNYPVGYIIVWQNPDVPQAMQSVAYTKASRYHLPTVQNQT